MPSVIRLCGVNEAMVDKNFAFRSERLSYRGITKEDAEIIVGWRSDPDNYKTFFNRRPITLEEHLAWFTNYLDDMTRYDFMVIDETGAPIGTVGLSGISTDACEISYMIGAKTARGKGYAKEAVRAATQLAFSEVGVRYVDARILPGNHASEKVVEGCGYAEVEHVFRIERADDAGGGCF